MPQQITEDDFKNAAKSLGCEVAAIKGVADVESSGNGFLKDGRLRVLFEGDQFYKYTKGSYCRKAPHIVLQKVDYG